MSRTGRWMSKTTLFLGIGALFLLVGAVAETARWRMAGSRSSWVTLKDPTAKSVSVAVGVDAFALLLMSPPSPAWKEQVGALDVIGPGVDPSIARKMYDSARSSGQIVELPNGTHGEVIDRTAFAGGRFFPPAPGSLAEKRSQGRFEVLEVRVRDGHFKGMTGWTLPELMQHDVAWP